MATKKQAYLLLLVTIFFAVGTYLFTQVFNDQPDPNNETSERFRIDRALPSSSSDFNTKEIMIAGIPASNTSGKFAVERPDDIDPYSRWMPPVVRERWLEKSNQVLSDLAPRGYKTEILNEYIHLGFKDKPATCGSLTFTALEEGSELDDAQRFIYTGRSTTVLERELTAAFEVLWQQLCVEKLYDY